MKVCDACICLWNCKIPVKHVLCIPELQTSVDQGVVNFLFFRNTLYFCDGLDKSVCANYNLNYDIMKFLFVIRLITSTVGSQHLQINQNSKIGMIGYYIVLISCRLGNREMLWWQKTVCVFIVVTWMDEMDNGIWWYRSVSASKHVCYHHPLT